MGLTHFDDAPAHVYDLGHLQGRWTMLGEAAGCKKIGVRRIEVPAGGWSTPAHEHGREEELFYVLSGRGVSWQRGRTAEIHAGDCILYRTRRGAHTVHAYEPLDLLAFGNRAHDEAVGFPRLEASIVGSRFVESVPYSRDKLPLQFIRESELGPPELPAEIGPRPDTIVNVEHVEGKLVERPNVVRTRRNLGAAVGSGTTGIQHVEVAPGKESAPLHCHSSEEEIFVMLGGGGVLVLDDEEETPVRPGHVVSRPAGTGVAHLFRAGEEGLTYLAYGMRDSNDICYYPRSNKINFGGVRVIARLEHVDYWDGEG
jgi:uncharacterized cupin superfamily protein